MVSDYSSRYASSSSTSNYSRYGSSSDRYGYENSRKRPADGIDLDEIMENAADKDSVAEKLDEVMQKRREKVEKWRMARKQKQDGGPSTAVAEGSGPSTTITAGRTASEGESWCIEGVDVEGWW